ncbi:hypothetical protein HRR83_001529 [Exophiala dermatitidis]|uniref:Uncharacterized protein n=2 Tax=Exophiala dermatitidis TaxID=5970 RepID=H6C653_EXODN|nr:uncharacterized protein HMPREF1120_07196 [Exophiala dermatitidis NIH/UT8656]KAJ4523015.1 hypothetical protein HRR75_001412 [Exophiala dermatitidis]EHY59199.1 hypothetical protein HMPREF1120_07196 [Exophiala dermatitidis NIH/UT8656]KAJ4526337.1 hypothetical protein HRR74_001533 [Exophiala dermatitidis]KAJ4526720.1 hypothetical protein HRR73_001514 [Exophiala dermatitidis]KAJ4532423.1 hypothetical protein HRR76_007417 [Exophiala dermatitidis]
MLSDRRSTISYAIDLLKAHQIRRENLFLHEELKSCRKEIDVLREEVKDARSAVEAIEHASDKTRCLFEDQQSRLSSQLRELEASQKECRAMLQSEISHLKTAQAQFGERALKQWEDLQKETNALKVDCQGKLDIQQRQQEEVSASLETLQQTLAGKVDTSSFEALVLRVDGLSRHPPVAAERLLSSVSRVPDSFEQPQQQRQSSPLPGQDDTQVRDSQAQRHQGRNRKHIIHERVQSPACQQVPQQNHERRRETTLPEDLDLDENAISFSYAVRRDCSDGDTNTLQLLPQSDVQAPQLVRVNLLQQRRYDDWDGYYSQGLCLIQSLPRSFEEAIVRNFVNGIFHTVQKKQCERFLDEKGWLWNNVTLFAKLCSQLYTSAGIASDDDLSMGDDPNEAGVLQPPTNFTAALGTLGKSESKVNETDKQSHWPQIADGYQAVPFSAGSRRGQRLVDKGSVRQSQPQQPTQVQFQKTRSRLKIAPADASQDLGSTKVKIQLRPTVRSDQSREVDQTVLKKQEQQTARQNSPASRDKKPYFLLRSAVWDKDHPAGKVARKPPIPTTAVQEHAQDQDHDDDREMNQPTPRHRKKSTFISTMAYRREDPDPGSSTSPPIMDQQPQPPLWSIKPTTVASKLAENRAVLPQLVPHKRAFHDMAALAGDSSHDEGQRLLEMTSKHFSPAAKVRRTGKKYLYRRPRRHLPLPPPPEIPILSTTSED